MNTKNQSPRFEPDAIAFLDEAGLAAKVRNLTKDHDGQIGLVAALMLPTADVDYWQNVFREPFESFKAAAPPKTKLHITDAFRSGNDNWAKTASQSREEIYELVKANSLYVTYLAREASVARRSHQMMQQHIDRCESENSSNISVSRHPSNTRVVSECYQGLVSTVDIMAEAFGLQHIALFSDEIDNIVLNNMEVQADRLRNISRREQELTAFDKQQKKIIKRRIISSTDFQGIDVTRVSTITKVGKSSSLAFAIDVIANSLLHHLQQHSVGTSLNTLKSVEGWQLAGCVFAPPNGCYDIYSKI